MPTPLIQRLALFVLVPLIAAAACEPLLRAGFQAEDFAWLALARHLDSPWPGFYQNVVFAYFYRPVGVVFWYLCTALAGSEAHAQNLVDLLLQAFNALLLALLATRLSRDRVTGLFAGVLFACLPATSATALWMSDRFDPLALCFGVLALLALDRALSGRHRGVALAALCLLLSLTAKEVGFAFVAAMLALIAWHYRTQREWRMASLAAVLLPLALVLAAHVLVVVSVDASLNTASQSPLALWRGVGYWWNLAPAALFGFRAQTGWTWGLVVATGMLVLVGFAVALKRRDRDASRLALVGIVLTVVPAFLQWPVTSLVLGSTAALAFITNIRFYYLATAGLALLWAAGWAGLRVSRARWLLLTATGALAVQWFATAHSIANQWANDTSAFSSRYLAVGRELAGRSFEPGCRIHLNAPDFPDEFAHYADVVVKGGAARGASVLDCAIFADGAPYMSVVSARQCTPSAWSGLQIRNVQGRGLMAPFGNLCMIAFDPPDFTTDDVRVHRFDVMASGELRLALPTSAAEPLPR